MKSCVAKGMSYVSPCRQERAIKSGETHAIDLRCVGTSAPAAPSVREETVILRVGFVVSRACVLPARARPWTCQRRALVT